MPPLPNVLFLLVDCLRSDYCIGSERRVSTPTIDHLIRNGCSVNQLIAVNSLTLPCVASIFSGQYPIQHNIRGHTAKDSVTQLQRSIVTEMKKLGYNTYAETAGPLNRDTRLLDGFDIIQWRDVQNGDKFFDEFGDDLVDRLKNGDFKEPWFLFLHIWSLHVPIEKPPQKYAKKGLTDYEITIQAIDKQLKELLGTINTDDLVIFTSDHGERVFRSKLSQRSAKLRIVIWKRARKIPFIRDLLIFIRNAFISKRGGGLEFGHGYDVFEYLINVPLCFYSPKLIQPQRLDIQGSQVDIAPTLMEVLGFKWEYEEGFTGKNLLEAQSRPVFCEATTNRSPDPKKWLLAVRDPPFKLKLEPNNKSKDPTLFRLDKDPEEKRNISTSYPEEFNALKDLCKSFLSSKGSVDEPDIDLQEEKEIRKRLEALGYF